MKILQRKMLQVLLHGAVTRSNNTNHFGTSPSCAQILNWLSVSSFARLYLTHCPRLQAPEQHLNMNLTSKLLTVVF